MAGYEPPSIYVLAHEFGHYLQFRSGVMLAGGPPGSLELEADCLGAYVIGLTPFKGDSDLRGFVERTYELAAALGDDLVNHPDHHGTAEQRVHALRAGYTRSSAELAAQQARAPGKRIVLSRSRALESCSEYAPQRPRPRPLVPAER
jgi:predicted metalloprotease